MYSLSSNIFTYFSGYEPNSGTFVDAVAVERRVQDRLQRVERFRKRQEDYLRYKKSKMCLKNKKNLGSLIWVLMVVHLLVFGSEKVVPLVAKQSSSRHGSVQPGDGVSSVAGLSLSVATTAGDVSVHGAEDDPDPQEGGDLERQGQLQRKKNDKKNNLGSLV